MDLIVVSNLLSLPFDIVDMSVFQYYDLSLVEMLEFSYCSSLVDSEL